jgi:hypothetical protein
MQPVEVRGVPPLRHCIQPVFAFCEVSDAPGLQLSLQFVMFVGEAAALQLCLQFVRFAIV